MKPLPAALAATALALAACAQPRPPAAVVPGAVTVQFVEPDRFTDARRSGGRGADPEVLAALREHLERLAPGCLAPDRRLTVRITDIDLAGETPFAVAPSEMRVLRDATWPRIELDWRLADGAGTPLAGATEHLIDMNYLADFNARNDSGQWRHDRALLTRWFRRSFCPG
ncbi:DUF3016 domain-containing protein [Derxia lacustris]|uniref:DUF3016 domain-containing protein n=1 Tax=Derxia lacustris TaxID=764842 RepID=UPI000A16E632|nr:DUF3016 domain-containing protein [Derxia lacustris]